MGNRNMASADAVGNAPKGLVPQPAGVGREVAFERGRLNVLDMKLNSKAFADALHERSISVSGWTKVMVNVHGDRNQACPLRVPRGPGAQDQAAKEEGHRVRPPTAADHQAQLSVRSREAAALQAPFKPRNEGVAARRKRNA